MLRLGRADPEPGRDRLPHPDLDGPALRDAQRHDRERGRARARTAPRACPRARCCRSRRPWPPPSVTRPASRSGTCRSPRSACGARCRNERLMEGLGSCCAVPDRRRRDHRSRHVHPAAASPRRGRAEGRTSSDGYRDPRRRPDDHRHPRRPRVFPSRHHQGRDSRALPPRRATDAAAPARPTGLDPALSGAGRQPADLPEGHPVAFPRLDQSGDRAQGRRNRDPRRVRRRRDARLHRQPGLHHAPRLAQPHPEARAARPDDHRPRSRRRRRRGRPVRRAHRARVLTEAGLVPASDVDGFTRLSRRRAASAAERISRRSAPSPSASPKRWRAARPIG